MAPSSSNSLRRILIVAGALLLLAPGPIAAQQTETTAEITPAEENPNEVKTCIQDHSEGQIQRDQGLLLSARDHFSACTSGVCPEPIRLECGEFLRDIGRVLPSVVVAAQDAAGNDLTNLRVELDGKPLEGIMSGLAVDIDPGTHLFRFQADDGRVLERSVLIREGEKARAITVRFPDPEPPKPEAPRPEPQSSGMSRKTIGLILGGVGVVALGSFTYFALSGKAKQSDLEDTCAPNCAQSDADGVSQSYLIADLSLLAAAGSFGVGAYFFLTPEASEAKPHQARGLTLNLAGRF